MNDLSTAKGTAHLNGSTPDIECAIDLLLQADEYSERMRSLCRGTTFVDKYGRDVGGLVKALQTMRNDLYLLNKELANINPAYPLGAGKAAEIERLRTKIFS